MTDATFKDLMARIDRTSPSFNDTLPALMLMFKVHEAKITDQQNQMNAFDKRIDTVKLGIFEDNAALSSHVSATVNRVHARIDFLEDRMTDMEACVPGPINNTTPAALTRDIESLTAYIHRLETLINDIEKELKARTDSQYDQLNSHIQFVEKAHNVRFDELKDSIAASDRARVRGDDAMHDLVTRTSNSLYAEIKKLEQRISDCELAVGTDKLELAPQRDTSWHPYDYEVDGISGDRPHDDAVVVVMFRDGNVQFPTLAGAWNWDDRGDSTIIAWRYAKEDE